MDWLKYKCKNNYINVFILGLVTALVVFLPFIIFDKGLFLYYGDFDVQQIPFYKLAHDAVQSGNTLWNWNTDLGVNFIGSYSFYLLGSPFFWVTLLFPSAAVPYLMAPLLILKFALTAVTGYAFINRFTRYNNTAMLGALLYAFSGFNIYNIFFNHFNEVVLVFPLLLLSLEELVLNKRRGGFALSVALCAMINYYFFFGQVIFVIIYYIVRCFSKDFRFTIRSFLLIALEAVLGFLMSAFLLVPAIMAITGNSRIGETLNGFDMLFYNNVQRYGLIFNSFLFPPDIPARPNFFPDSNAKWSSVSMFLPMLSISGVVAFFIGVKKHWAKILLTICLVFSFVPILNASFSAFNFSYYARWFYMPLLIMAMVSCLALERDMKHLKHGLIVTSILSGLALVIGIIPKNVDGKLEFFSLPPYPERFWAYIAVAAIGILVTALLVVLTYKHKRFMAIAMIGVIGISVLYSSFMIYTGKLAGEGYDVVATKAINGRENITLDESQFYRIDTYDELDNLGMHWGMPTINAFHSIVPPSIMDYYEAIDSERGVASRPKPNLTGVRALTSVKYQFIAEENENPSIVAGFEYFDTQNGYKIYENKYFIPMGFTYDYFITEDQLNSANANKDRLMLKGILLEEKDQKKYKDYLSILPNEAAYEDALYNEDYYKACEKLAANSATSFKYDNQGFEARIVSDKKNLIFLSVPYDEGWSASVNSNHVDIIRANKGFMAVEIPEGASVIRFDYKTPGGFAGVIISVVAVLLLMGYIFLVRWYRKKEPEKYFYDKYGHLRITDNPPDMLAHYAYMNKVSRIRKPKKDSDEKPFNDNKHN